MAEYIEREALIDNLKCFAPEHYNALINMLIEKQPAADVVEVVHGAWENYPSHVYRRCSVCKVEFDKPKFNVRANYCPHCGAKMDGERRSE